MFFFILIKVDGKEERLNISMKENDIVIREAKM